MSLYTVHVCHVAAVVGCVLCRVAVGYAAGYALLLC